MGKRGDSWRHNEEAILFEVWITVGGDGATGINQSADTLWERVAVEYNKNKPASCMERTSSSVNSRWKVINQACGKWRESLDKAKTLHRSGENELDEVILFINVVLKFLFILSHI